MHITDLEKLSDADVMPSPTRLFDYSKATIPTKGQAKLKGKDKVNQVEASQVEYTPAPSPPPGELTLEYIKHAYPHLFEGLGELGPPFSFSLNSEV